jgi:hypothetical protein
LFSFGLCCTCENNLEKSNGKIDVTVSSIGNGGVEKNWKNNQNRGKRKNEQT